MEKLISIAMAIGLFGGLYDVLTRRIPNWLTFSSIILGLMAQIIFFSWPGFLQSIMGIGSAFLLFFPLFYFGYMGAGDVKLAMAMGAWVGLDLSLYTVLFSVIWGGGFAFFEVLFRGRMQIVITNTLRFIRSALVPQLVLEPLSLDKNRKFAFGLCIPFGLATAFFLMQEGKLP